MLSIMLIVLVVSLVIGLPIGVILLITAFAPTLINPSFVVDLPYIFRNMVLSLDNTTMLAVPLFMFSGVIMARGEISNRIFDVFSYIFGRLPGGLPSTVVISCLFYGAISGSGPATTAAIGAMTIPLMTKLGYDLTFSTALVCVAGGLGVIIPPSIPFIVYSMSSGGCASVGSMFIAGILPGILIAIVLIAYTVIYCIIKGEDRKKINAKVEELRKESFWKVARKSFWAFLCPVIILGSIYSGVATPTEAAAISVIYALVVSILVYKSISLEDMFPILRETTDMAASVLFVIGSAMLFAKAIALLRVPEIIGDSMGGIADNPVLLLLTINLIMIIVGAFLDTASAILIMTPMMLPLVQAVGINPVHFGIILVINLAIGFVTPPVGTNLYVAAGMTGINVLQIAKKSIPLLIVFLFALMLITFIPQISLALL